MVVLSRDSNPFYEFGKAIWLLGLVLPKEEEYWYLVGGFS